MDMGVIYDVKCFFHRNGVVLSIVARYREYAAIIFPLSLFFSCLVCDIISLSFLRKMSSYCGRQIIYIVVIVVVMQNFNVAHYSKSIKVSTPNLEYLLIMTRCSCKTRGITLMLYFLELCPF